MDCLIAVWMIASDKTTILYRNIAFFDLLRIKMRSLKYKTKNLRKGYKVNLCFKKATLDIALHSYFILLLSG